MALTGIQIFKLLPKTNCGKCGVPTCLAFAMNLAAGKAELSACPTVSEEAKALVTYAPSGVKLLPAPSRPEYAEHVTDEQFAKILNYLRRLYSNIVVDTSSTLTDPTLAAIDTGDLVILITSQDIPAIKNARLFLDLAEVLKINRKRVLFVMNRFDKRINITPEKVGESFKHSISAVLPLEERVVIPSLNRGRPFMLDDKTRPISRSVLLLAEVVRQRLTDHIPVSVLYAQNFYYQRLQTQPVEVERAGEKRRKGKRKE